ncbi:MAG TPA: PhzF family phenazine biosynthesis protein [Capillimicrobium sp.]|nr:PhzF family phenazine biosynthesis protein [Capillimicrobium sp.]
MARPLTWLDVFTSTPMTGNPVAVVHEADDLDGDTMRAFARETNLSETTFVQTPTEPGADYRNRIWMPHRELDFAGHPSLGTAVAVAWRRGEREAGYVQQTRAGLQPIDVRFDGDVARASMLQGATTFGDELDVAEALGVVGLGPDDADPELPSQVVSTGQPQALVFVRDAERLGDIRADAETLDRYLESVGGLVLYLAAVGEDGEVRARGLFVSHGDVREDPATGAAAGALMGHLHAHAGADRCSISQGVEMGRPSRLECAIEGDRVRVGGDVVLLAEGEIAL